MNSPVSIELNPVGASAGAPTRARRHVLPGYRLTLGFTIFYLSLIVLLPLIALFVRSMTLNWHAFWEVVTAPRVLATYRITFGSALLAAIINLFVGLQIAWVLVRYDFPGKKIVDALIDLPFALPTAVAGIALTALLADNGWVGQYLSLAGIHLAFNPAGIVIALVFVGLPFVVRAVQPVLEDAEQELEEAAASLGARSIAIFLRVTLPTIAPALLAGFAMAFARGIGEYGSVVFIAGNMPMISEITPLLILVKLEQFDYPATSAIGVVLLVLSFFLLLLLNGISWLWQRRFQ